MTMNRAEALRIGTAIANCWWKLNMLETILEAFNEQMGKDMTKTLIEYVNEQTDKLGLLADNVETIEQLSYEQCALMERAIAAKRKELDKK
ncbi:TPA: hypothetical protein IX597_000346 [Enterococcus faecium]|nr:hypothetical protein [Enterococcus faecium]